MSNLKLYKKRSRPVVLTALLSIAAACGVPMEENSSTKVQPKKENQYDQLKKGFILLNKEPVEIRYVEQDGFARFSDDILVPLDQVYATDNPPTNLAAAPNKTRWTNGRVPYVLAPNFPYVADFNAAVRDWAVAGISWVPRTPADANFVRVTADLLDMTACGIATVGQGPARTLRVRPLAIKCSYPQKFILLHEMAHTLGFLHEFTRSDRDAYLVGLTDPQYAKVANSNNIFNSPFDYSSVTMYPTTAIPSMKTIGGAAIPTPTGLSQIDLDRTSAYYFGNLQCSVIGGAGATLFSGLTSKYGCASQCNSRSATNPDRSCSWNNAVFVGLSQCRIVGGQGTVLFNSTATKFQCTQQCNSRSITNPGRSCTWNNVIFAGGAVAGGAVAGGAVGMSQCSIVGGLGTVLFNSTATQSQCTQQCNSRSITNPDRSCTWNNVIFAGAAQCNIVGGMGARLYSAVVAKYPCVQQCRSRATTHANRSCVWNGTNIKGQ